jgi:hypothetical protein
MITRSESTPLRSLLDAATPFLRITGVRRHDWCRLMEDPDDGRIGPWKYFADYVVLDQKVWGRRGEVIYFVTDASGKLRLVGQSMSKLRGRWKPVPMYDAKSLQPMGRKALFHTSSWPAIEAGFDSGDSPPFTVSVLFRDRLEPLCKALGDSLSHVLAKQETHLHRLSYHVETWVCSLDFGASRLWNKQKVNAA